jgi:hypothetical protein
MAPEKTTKRRAPSVVADFTILPLTLPTLSGLPASHESTQHYLYIKPHEPSAYTATAERSLFVANVPIDASESNIRALFAEQLGGARVESVDFDASVPARPLHKRWKQEKRGDDEIEAGQRGKKRKRNDAEVVAEGVVEDEDSALPALWASEVRRSGSAAVVVFVDKRSARGALKEIQAAVKSGRAVQWKAGSGLGVERKFHHPSRRIEVKENRGTSKLISYRLQIAPRTRPPLRLRPAVQHKRLPHPVQRARNPARQAPQARPHRSRRRRLHHRRARRARRPRAYRRGREEEGRARGAEEEQRCQGRLLPLPEPREEEGGRDQPAQAVRRG